MNVRGDSGASDLVSFDEPCFQDAVDYSDADIPFCIEIVWLLSVWVMDEGEPLELRWPRESLDDGHRPGVGLVEGLSVEQPVELGEDGTVMRTDFIG